ncbi:CobW C-terminal domain-containing protein [Plasmodiophora brassicae]
MDLECASVNLFNRFENTVIFADSRKKPMCPVTLITGELGGGKTTLVKHVLRNKRNLRIVAIVNDFAALNVDAASIRSSSMPIPDTTIVELSNGCMCCVGDVERKFEEVVGHILKSSDDCEHVPPDAIIIETSGVTDPVHIIARLERRYGPMTRCRLDCVVTVVDSDVLSERLSSGSSATRSWTQERQLLAADVVVLNKTDLLDDDQASAVERYVREMVPGVRTLRATFGNVPLHDLLDIERDVNPSGQVVAHESGRLAQRPLAMSSAGGALRRTDRVPAGQVPTRNPTADDNMQSFVFESNDPLRLAAFQDWLHHQMPSNVARMKGFLWFDFERSTFREVHLSGNRRYHVGAPDVWQGPPRVSLAFIAGSLDVSAIASSLQHACQPSRPSQSPLDSLSVIASDLDFAISGSPCAKQLLEDWSIVAFRLTSGTRYRPDTPDQVARQYGIDFDRINQDVAMAVNMTAKGSLLLLGTWIDDQYHLIWDLGSTIPLSDVVAAIRQTSKPIVDRVFSRVHLCKNGY